MNDLTLEVKTIALNLMEGLACPRSVMVAILIRSKEWVQLAQLKTDPRLYAYAEDYFRAAQATDFLRKFEGLPTGIDTEAVARETWYESERQCWMTNRRLDPYTDPLWGENDTRINAFFERVRHEVRTLIGVCPPKDINLSFGKGATLSDNSRHVTVADKMSSIPTLTPRAWPFLVDWISTKWGQAQAALGHDGVEVSGNAFFTVKKDALTDRGCGKEPSINIAYQLDVGKIMRHRMLFSGIDLSNGQSIHRQVACVGSFTDEIVTIDLTSASDTNSRTLVKLCVSPAWYELLDSLRSHTTTFPQTAKSSAKTVRLEKFSSMGNGFTFELESVIFCAIARAVCKDDHEWSQVSVYGDDIIAPKARCDDIIAALKFCGFTPNKSKTYTTGGFRESCGGDFFNGQPVRAYFLKSEPNEPQDFISIANGLRRVALTSDSADDRWHRTRRAWFSCLDFIPAPIRRCRGPEGLGDIAIHDAEEYWQQRTEFSIRYIRTYRPVGPKEARWEGFAYDVQFAVALYLAGKGREQETRLPNGNLALRDTTTGYRVGWTAYS